MYGRNVNETQTTITLWYVLVLFLYRSLKQCENGFSCHPSYYFALAHQILLPKL